MVSGVRGGATRVSAVSVAHAQPPLAHTADAVGRPISGGFYNSQTSLLQGVHQPPAPFKNSSGWRTARVDHHEQFAPNGHTMTTHAQDALPPPRTRIVQASTTRCEQRARKRDLVLDQLRQQAAELRRRDRLLWTLLEERLAASQRIQTLLLDKKNFYVGGVGTTTARRRRKADKRGTSFAEDEDDINCGSSYMMDDYDDDQVVFEDGASSRPWDHDQQALRAGEDHLHLNHRHRAGAMRTRPHDDPAPIDTATQIRTRTAAGTTSFLPYLRNLIQSAGSTDVATFEALFDAILDEGVVEVDREEPQEADQRSYLNIGENDLKSSTSCLSSAIFDFDEAFL
ncbi:unnamed protein product [Amoebophrya sp. A120]|nr:unnamed protein product [Amoebophrya sp. A120]|eukprot:GSA120T00009648001.1